ncbi:MAG: ParB/RepB/Spo0J family partition protein [Clostridiales bacterium]|nr:ParB/RepB/Spo0J family partition protein [Clostridiales bacterium]
MKKGLGKGINALISTPISNISAESEEQQKSGAVLVDINKIEPNLNQPRKFFDNESLAELAESIKSYGIIQPLLVKDEGAYFSLIAGERRWRAARIAKLTEVPVIIKDYNEVDTIQVALIENIQREDLNPIEEAECYQRLMDEFFFTQEDIANKIGKSRSLISTFLNLLNLDDRVKNFIAEGKISATHGKLLLQVTDSEKQFSVCENFIENKMSARQAEEYIQIINNPPKFEIKKVKVEINPKDKYKNIETDLKSLLGTKVNIKDGKSKGKIEIEYYSNEELDRLIMILKNSKKIF